MRPVLNDKDYDKALALFNQSKLKEYNKIKAEQLAERKRLDMQADIQRNFSINGFGIYNWDVWHNPDRTKCIAKPQFDELAKVDINNTNISYFLVSKGRKAVVKYSNETLAKFSFNPSDNNSLLAVLPEGKVAIFSAYDFKQLDVEKIKNSDTLMRMATSTKTIKSLDDLNTIIDHAMS